MEGDAMGFGDKLKGAASAVKRVSESTPESAPPPAPHMMAPPGRPRFEYAAVVNKGNLNVNHLTATLNQRGGQGWRLAHIFEQHGNTVLVYEREM